MWCDPDLATAKADGYVGEVLFSCRVCARTIHEAVPSMQSGGVQRGVQGEVQWARSNREVGRS